MPTTVKFIVTGMSCSHCENAVREEISELAGVESVDVSATDGSLSVTLRDHAPTQEEAILAAVDEAGYQAEAV